MADQAYKLRQLANNLKADLRQRSLPGRGRCAKVIAITSGKGGVGKTNFAVNLGIGLIQQGRDVLLFDADLGLANVDVILGTNPSYHLGHVVKGEKKIQDIIYRGPSGIRLVAGGSGLAELLDLGEADLRNFVASIKDLESMADYILLDTGAGLSRQVVSFVLSADEIIVVTNSEPTAMTDAYATIKVITRKNPAASIKLVLNQVEDTEEAEIAVNRLTMAALRFLGIHVESLGTVPADSSVPRAVKKQQPFLLAYPNAPASRAVRSLSKTVDGQNQGSELNVGLFFDRLAKFFTNLRA